MIEARSASSRLRLAFVSATVAWALLLPLAAFGASRTADSSLVHLSAAVPYAIGAFVCHQQSARSFHVWSRQLPVCARCTGIYAGAALAALVALFFRTATAARHNEPRRRSPNTRASGGGSFRPARTLVLAGLPTLATLAYEWSTGATPSNAIRALAGIPLGAAVASVILAAADNQVN